MLDSNDDWVEGVRLFLYPKLHDPLSAFGDVIGINLFALGHVGDSQFAGYLDEDEDRIEEGLDNEGERNPIACLKELEDGRESEGSWVLLHEDLPESIEEGRQVHITLFDREDGSPGREIYAHYEDDWRVHPIAHLRSENFDAERGVSITVDYFENETDLDLHDT